MKLFTLKNLSRVFALVILVSVFSCKQDKKKDREEILQSEEPTLKEKRDQAVEEAKKIFYSLPSPLETAIIFKNAGASYNPDILNPYNKATDYQTTRKMALNLGVYSADLSYTSLFDQTQMSVRYMAAAKELAKGLGIMEAFDRKMIQKLEENVNNKAVVMDIISQAFMSSNISLKKDDRDAVATIVLVGGWIEGLYIATQLSDKNYQKNELVQRIVDQRLPLNSIINLMETYKENEDVAVLLKDIYVLKDIFDQIQVKSSGITPVRDSSSNITTLKSKTETTVGQDVFERLCDKVESLRNDYVS